LQLTREQAEFRDRVHEYAVVFRDQVVEWDDQDDLDIWPVMRRAHEYGLTGITISKEYGGQDLGAFEWTLAVEEIARTAMSWLPADPLFMTAGPGPAIILASENEALKKTILPRLVRGEAMAAINITEPEAGSAMTDLATTAIKDGDEYIISGSKRHITGAGVAEYLVTFCRFEDVPGAKGIGAVLIENDREGVVCGRNPNWLGLRGIPHPEVTLREVRIPTGNLLFPPGHFARLMRAFNLERLHNAVLSLGFAQAAFELSRDFVVQRRQFGRSIVEFQGVQWQLADMHVDIEAARALIYQAAQNADEGKYPAPLDISVAKLFANEMGIRVVHQAADLHGALGYTRDYPLERLLRDSLVMPVAGGSVNILRNTIAAELFPGSSLSQRRPVAGSRVP
jgi:alkylation response protein AidB-like acyl-CoA dehydrogenase